MSSTRLQPRDATPEDHAAFLRFFAELKLPHDPPPTPEAWADMCKDAFFLQDGEALVAYALVHVVGGEAAHVYHVVVDPAHRGRKVGDALMREIADRLGARGVAKWHLNVRPDNAPAIRLYERFGMRATYRAWSVRVAWADVARLPASDREARRVDDGGAEDEAIERTFDLTSGYLAMLRSQGGRILLGVGSARETFDAFASFDPTFPGARPFRAKSAALARALFEAMREHKRPDHDAVRVAVEADPALLRALTDVGGEVVLDIVHMEGAVPG